MLTIRRSLLVLVFCGFFLVLFYHSLNRKKSASFLLREELYNNWKRCVLSKIEPHRGNHAQLWLEFPTLVSQCDQPYVELLSVKEFANSDETKHHILPLKDNTNNTIVSLGIGHDITAEEKLLEALGKDNAQFYGADPVMEMNSALYSKIGKYYPLAVGAQAGFSEASVLKDETYQPFSVVHVDAIYFLTKMIGQKFYDDIWFDVEYAEYDMFPMFLNGGALDENGITICQFNMEMHQPTDDQQRLVHDFIFQILEDGRYAFFFPVYHLRLYFVNFKDTDCANKYIPKSMTIKPLP